MTTREPSKKPASSENLVTLSVLGVFSTGIAALVVAIAAYDDPMEDWLATSIALVAAALAFGLLTNALLRD